MIKFLIGGDSSELRDEAKKGKQSLADLRKEFRDGVNAAGKWTIATVAAGAAISAHLVDKSIDAITNLKNLTQVANASIVVFQKQAIAAKSVGIESDKLADIYKDVNDRIGDFISDGGGPMLKFFEQIGPKVGVTIEDFKKLSGPQALQLYVSSLEKANVSQAEMTFYLEAMASDSTKLLPLLRDGGRAMKEQGDQAERLGIILSDIDAAKVENAGKALSRIGTIGEGVANQMTAQLAPVIDAVGLHFIGAAEEAGGFGNVAEKQMGRLVDATAFVLDAIEGIKRTFSVVADGIIISFEGLKGGIVQIAAEITGALDKVPGVDLTETTDELQGLASASTETIDAAWEHIQQTLDEPLPSESFKRFVAEAQETAQQVAEATVEARKKLAELGGGGGEGGGSSLNEKEQEAMQKRIEQLQETFATERELQMIKFEEDQELLDEALANKIISEEQYWKDLTSLNERYQRDINKIDKDAADARERIAKMEADSKKKILGDALSNLTTLMNSESRKMFEVGKAAAIGQSLINTYQSFTAALAQVPWPLNYVAAAANLAAGFAQIQNIRSQSFGGGGGGAAATGSNTAAVNAASTPVGGQAASAGPNAGQSMFVSGDFDEGSFFSGKRVAAIAKQLVDFQRDGGDVVFAS